MTDHTRTEKIVGDSIFIFGSLPSCGGKPLWQLGDSTGDLESLPISSHMLSSMLFRMLDLFVFHFVICLWYFILSCLNNCDLFAHTHVYLHNISSIPELRPFRRKCWLRSREIVIPAMASQTFPEFMVLMTSWGSNLCIVIRKCSHSNRTLSIWTYNGWGSGCLISPIGTAVRNDSGTF